MRTMGAKNLVRATAAARAWMGKQPLKTKLAISAALVLLWVFVNDRGLVMFISEISHATGISFLVYKLIKEGTCAGLSLKSQELTAMFLALKIYCIYTTNFNMHAVIDIAALITTLWVVYMIRVIMKFSYMKDEDNFSMQSAVAPCALLALFIHPTSSSSLINRFILAFGCNLETIAMLPQVHLMQNTKTVESLAAHYVFALGVSRFLSCAHWIIQIFGSRGTLLLALGYGLWPAMVLVSEIIQTLILADFCYYYIKSVIEGHSVLKLPSDAV